METFAFDPAGNLTDDTPQKNIKSNTAGIDHQSWEEGLDHLTEQLFHAAGSKIAPVTHNLLKSYLNAEFEHDAEGNTIRKIVKARKDEQPYSLTLHYDPENRLVKAIRPGSNGTIEADYVYEAFSRRIAKVVRTLKQEQATGTYGVTGRMETISEEITFFAWDGDTLIQEIQPDKTITYLYEPDSFVPLAQVHSDTPDSVYELEEARKKLAKEEQREAALEQEAENLKWLRVTDAKAHALAVEAIGERSETERQQAFERLEKEAQHDRIYYINTDHLGTPQEVVSDDGNVVWLAKYKAWGRVYALKKDEFRQPLRFQGQYEDEETGLYYNRYRYYDPESARYLTQDPIGLLGGSNSYQYAPNPTGWADPRGLARSGGKGGSPGSMKAKGTVSYPTTCDPCAGKNPAAEARSWQGSGNYPGVDTYINTVLKKGTILYSLHPGDPPGYAVTNHTLAKAGGDSKKYHELVQVVPGVDRRTGLPRSLRTNVQVYRAQEDICVAKGQALSQVTSTHGSGGATQYYVPQSERSKLKAGKVRPL